MPSPRQSAARPGCASGWRPRTSTRGCLSDWSKAGVGSNAKFENIRLAGKRGPAALFQPERGPPRRARPRERLRPRQGQFRSVPEREDLEPLAMSLSSTKRQKDQMPPAAPPRWRHLASQTLLKQAIANAQGSQCAPFSSSHLSGAAPPPPPPPPPLPRPHEPGALSCPPLARCA